MQNYAEILFVNEVRALQEEDGSAQKYESIYPTRTKDLLDAVSYTHLTLPTICSV